MKKLKARKKKSQASRRAQKYNTWSKTVAASAAASGDAFTGQVPLGVSYTASSDAVASVKRERDRTPP